MKHLLYLLLAGSLLTEQPLYGAKKKNKKTKKIAKKGKKGVPSSAVATTIQPVTSTPTQISQTGDIKDIAIIKKNTENKIDELINKTRKQFLKEKEQGGLGNNEDTQKKLKTLFNLIEPAQKIILDTKKGIYTEIITLSKNLSALSNNLSDPKNKEIYNSFKSEFLNILNQYNLDITAAEQAEKEKIEKKKKITEDWNHELSSIDVNIFGNHKNEIKMALKTIKNGADLKKFLIFVVNKALNIDLNKEQNITQEQLKKASTALENCLIRFNNNNSERDVLKSYFNGVIQNIVINVAKIKKNIKSTEMLDIIKKEINDSLTKDEIFSSQAPIEKKKKIKDTKKKKDQDKKIVKTPLESEEYKLEKLKKTEEKQKRKEEYEKKQQIAKDVKKNEGAENLLDLL